MNGHRAEAEPGGKGQYDVYVDDELVFSKRDEGRFPEPTSDAAGDTRSRAVIPSPIHVATAAQLTAEVGDEKLRKVVAKTAALSLAKAESARLFW